MSFNGLTKKNNPVINDSMTSLENPFPNDKYKTHFMFFKNHDTFYEEKLMPGECAQQSKICYLHVVGIKDLKKSYM